MVRRSDRPVRRTLPGIAKIRITAVEVLRREFVIREPSGQDGGGVYLDAVVGNPAPDTD